MRLSDPNNDKASLTHRRTSGVAFNWGSSCPVVRLESNLLCLWRENPDQLRYTAKVRGV
jgi:hypothetical protein